MYILHISVLLFLNVVINHTLVLTFFFFFLQSNVLYRQYCMIALLIFIINDFYLTA